MRPEESFSGQSVRSLQTMLRVIGEADGRLPVVVPDGIYGQNTMVAVSTFQRQYGLPSTGVTDQATWEEIVRQYEPALIRVGEAQPIEVILEPDQTFRRGDRSPYIYLMQAMLSALSWELTSMPMPAVTGILDEDSTQALIAFQQLAGLTTTGELDRITWKHLSHQFTLFANHQSRF